jgi:hypothetical protein
MVSLACKIAGHVLLIVDFGRYLHIAAISW